MKKNKQKAQLKADRKKAEKAVKAALINDLTTLVNTYAEPNKKLKKLIEKAASAFSKEVDKTAKPIAEVAVKAEDAVPAVAEKKPAKAGTIKKSEKVATK